MPKKLNDLPNLSYPSQDTRVYVLHSADITPTDAKARLGNLISIDFIIGLQMEWISGNSIRVKTGAAALPDGRLIRVKSDKTLSSMTLAANTWYHLYLQPDENIQYVTTAPAAPYFGAARTQTGNTSRRYLGSIRTNASGSIFYFVHSGNHILYADGPGTTVLNNGTATSVTLVSVASFVPETANICVLNIRNISTSSNAEIYSQGIFYGYVLHYESTQMLINKTNVTYRHDAAPNAGVFIYVNGYIFDR